MHFEEKTASNDKLIGNVAPGRGGMIFGYIHAKMSSQWHCNYFTQELWLLNLLMPVLRPHIGLTELESHDIKKSFLKSS